ncbi:TetR/AcrR family transcriptional regulator [Conexibacter sp. CPCC 206217]|uniref:TetR/AcrR family transcriptional regulator n=1 Tax=Conexibacter sp. CPCC 206217 TaxID=3064574 RepID=UPI0027215DDA|nr:TetR family transcriptional regulator C-terminal domain-containing protein [Conexibacter sp. CPCC 206217]MDO8211749.1 TetR family transcriptional regulator C-terminal domain-containing protein [Conexibacter sp. CPCC 206217]
MATATRPLRLTVKGAATRARIVASTADLILARGVGGTSLDDIRLDTATSKSQLFHYFPEGKAELVRAVAEFQADRVLDAQRPELETLDDFATWERWSGRVLDHYGSQQHGWGCPIGALTNEAAAGDDALRRQLAAYFDRWAGYLQRGIERMRDAGLLRAEVDPAALATNMLATLQGALLLTQAHQSIAPLQTALDGILASLRAWAAPT